MGRNYALFLGDAVEVVAQLPERSVDLQVYSPPFANLYTYSDSLRDMGNCANEEEFIRSYRFLVRELYRTLRPGRICAVHCKDMIRYKGAHGRAGFYDFPGDIIRAHEAEGYQYHSRITIWKCPVTEMQRTKNHGLLYKQLRKDSTISRQGMAEYVLLFRRWPDGSEDEAAVLPVPHTTAGMPLEQWQDWASPVWMDIQQTNTLNCRMAREDGDEKHMCPLQLDVIERLVRLYSNHGDVVLSPFAGIGSEGYGALRFGRRFVGVELKRSYFESAIPILDGEDIERQQSLFG
jgi:DNA modification methylase